MREGLRGQPHASSLWLRDRTWDTWTLLCRQRSSLSAQKDCHVIRRGMSLDFIFTISETELWSSLGELTNAPCFCLSPYIHTSQLWGSGWGYHFSMWLTEIYQESSAKLSVNDEFIVPSVGCNQIMISEGHSLIWKRRWPHMLFLSKRKKTKQQNQSRLQRLSACRVPATTQALSQVLLWHPFIRMRQLKALCYSRHFLYLSTGALLGSSEFLADRVCKKPTEWYSTSLNPPGCYFSMEQMSFLLCEVN